MTDHTDKTAPEGDLTLSNPFKRAARNRLDMVASGRSAREVYHPSTWTDEVEAFWADVAALQAPPADPVGGVDVESGQARSAVVNIIERHIQGWAGEHADNPYDAAPIIAREILAALSPSSGAELSRPITFQDVRLAVGEGKLTATDVLAGVNAELRRRAALSPSPVEKLVEALEPVVLSVASLDGVYGFDDDKPVNTRDFGAPYNDFTGLTWGDLRRVVQALAAARQTGGGA